MAVNGDRQPERVPDHSGLGCWVPERGSTRVDRTSLGREMIYASIASLSIAWVIQVWWGYDYFKNRRFPWDNTYFSKGITVKRDKRPWE